MDYKALNDKDLISTYEKVIGLYSDKVNEAEPYVKQMAEVRKELMVIVEELLNRKIITIKEEGKKELATK